MNKEFAQKWIDLFFSAETPTSMYADGGVCEDYLLDLRLSESQREEWKRLCALWSDTDVMGNHKMLVTDYMRDGRIGVIQWVWEADCNQFLGIPTNGKKIHTTCMTVQIYDDDGKIVHDWTWWDAINMLKQCGIPLRTPHVWNVDWSPEKDDGSAVRPRPEALG